MSSFYIVSMTYVISWPYVVIQTIRMPHQWTQGNLPVNAKCLVCDRTCGSLRRLQDYYCLWCHATVSYMMTIVHWNNKVLVIQGRKCTLAASRAALGELRWVCAARPIKIRKRPNRHTDRRQTVTLHLPLDAASVLNVCALRIVSSLSGRYRLFEDVFVSLFEKTHFTLNVPHSASCDWLWLISHWR